MNSPNAIQQELENLRSSLPPDSKQPVFTVPEGYFENLAASVLAQIKSQQATSVADELGALSPVLAAISRKPPFSVPENYFTDLATSLPALLNDAALPDFLNSHTKQMPYPVPSGYFDGLAAQVAAKVASPKAKVVSFSYRVLRLAAAAVIAGIIVTAGFFYIGQNRSTIDPAKNPAAWVAEKLKNVPKSDIEAFLKTVDTGSNQELAQKGGDEVRQMLRDVSTTELDAFLNELPPDNNFSSIN